jgi:hypothetical protein
MINGLGVLGWGVGGEIFLLSVFESKVESI